MTSTEAHKISAEKYLNQYQCMKAIMEATLLEIEQLQAIAEKTVSVLKPDKIQTSSDDHKNEAIIIKISSLWDRYNAEIDDCTSIMDEIKHNVFDYASPHGDILFKEYVKGMTVKELAFEYECSYNTIKTRKRHGLDKIQRNLLLYPEKFTIVTKVAKFDQCC